MLKSLFEKCSKENRAALILYVCCGDFSIDFSEMLISKICSSGADIVELGVPFSDPMVDGTSIQAAHTRALKNSTSLGSVIEMVKRLRLSGVDKTLVLNSYFNPIFKMGVEKALSACLEAGIDAIYVVDIPLEEFDEIAPIARAKGIDVIVMATPASSLERIRTLSENGSGFLYYATNSGNSGASDVLPDDMAIRLDDVRNASKLPVAAGLRISTSLTPREVARKADAVVVPSAVVDLAYATLLDSGADASLEAVGSFVASLASSMKR